MKLNWWNNRLMMERICLAELKRDYPFVTVVIYIGKTCIEERNFTIESDARRYAENKVSELCAMVYCDCHKETTGGEK